MRRTFYAKRRTSVKARGRGRHGMFEEQQDGQVGWKSHMSHSGIHS